LGGMWGPLTSTSFLSWCYLNQLIVVYHCLRRVLMWTPVFAQASHFSSLFFFSHLTLISAPSNLKKPKWVTKLYFVSNLIFIYFYCCFYYYIYFLTLFFNLWFVGTKLCFFYLHSIR